MSAAEPGEHSPDRLTPGTRAEVRSRFTGDWSPGFMVEDADDDGGYRLRRRSDGKLLPDRFAFEVVRRERRSMWWM